MTHILLIEDNPADALLMMELLSDVSFSSNVHHVADGVAAMDYLYRRVPFTEAPRPDIILLDLNLPKKSGHEVLRDIKQDAGLSTIPVIVLSTSARLEDMHWCTQHQAHAYITKPEDLPNYEKLIERLTTVEFPYLLTAGERRL